MNDNSETINLKKRTNRYPRLNVLRCPQGSKGRKKRKELKAFLELTS